MADRMALVARALNRVESVGEERAAITAALGELATGRQLAGRLNAWTVPSVSSAHETIAVLDGALQTELRLLAPRADDAAVDPNTWARARRQIERAYIDVSGIEGAAGAVARIDTGQILLESIANAPKVLGQVVGDVVGGAGGAAGGLLGGLAGGLGWWGWLLVAVVAAFAILPRRIA